MAPQPPQTLSVKRKRTDAPVDALILDSTVKRQKNQPHDGSTIEDAPVPSNFVFRRLTKPSDTPPQLTAPTDVATPTTTAPSERRKFHIDPVSRARARHVFIERYHAPPPPTTTTTTSKSHSTAPTAQALPVRPRKRPGASSALRNAPTVPTHGAKPSEHDVAALEALAHEVESAETGAIQSPSKYKPRVPAQRFAERNPDKAAELEGDAMDVDGDEYVIDTYVREAVVVGADGVFAPPEGAVVGWLVLGDEDEDWWATGEDESDREFDTDDDDENAEDYYANDYPEDEMSDDDEFGRDVYQSKYRHGSDDEEFDLRASDSDDAVGSGEDEDDLHFKMTRAQKPGYWGMNGQ